MPNYEGQTVDEAIQKGLASLNLSQKEVEIQVLEEGKKGFLGLGKKEAKVMLTPLQSPQETIVEEVISQVTDTAINEAKNNQVLEKLTDDAAITELTLYLTNITKELNAPASVEVETQKGLTIFHLESPKAGMLIGKHGKVLNALQYLAQVFIHRVAENKLSVVVNVGDYRERREATLQRLANNTADKVMRTGQAVFLEPMPAFERKQIHAILTENSRVKTHSEGDEPFRYLVVEPAKTII